MNRGALRAAVRSELQEPTEGFWSDADLNTWLNEANAEIVKTVRAEASSSFTTTANQEWITLPTDFFLMRRVEMQTTPGSSSGWFVVEPISVDLRQEGDPLSPYLPGVPAGWYVLGGKLYFVPAPSLAFSGTLYYFKNATPMTADGDTPFYPEGQVAETVDPLLQDYVVAKAFTRRQDPAYTIYAGRYNSGLAALTKDAVDRGNANSNVVINDWNAEF